MRCTIFLDKYNRIIKEGDRFSVPSFFNLVFQLVFSHLFRPLRVPCFALSLSFPRPWNQEPFKESLAIPKVNFKRTASLSPSPSLSPPVLPLPLFPPSLPRDLPGSLFVVAQFSFHDAVPSLEMESEEHFGGISMRIEGSPSPPTANQLQRRRKGDCRTEWR